MTTKLKFLYAGFKSCKEREQKRGKDLETKQPLKVPSSSASSLPPNISPPLRSLASHAHATDRQDGFSRSVKEECSDWSEIIKEQSEKDTQLMALNSYLKHR